MTRLQIDAVIGSSGSRSRQTGLRIGRLARGCAVAAALGLMHEANAEPPPAIDACSLLLSSEIETAVGLPIASGARDDAGITTNGAYSSTCIWEVDPKSAGPADPRATVGGRRFVMLLAMRWPLGSPSARTFLDSFREAAMSGALPKAPSPRNFGDEALQWGDGLAVRKGEIAFGISVVLAGAATGESREVMEERLAPIVLRRLKQLAVSAPT